MMSKEGHKISTGRTFGCRALAFLRSVPVISLRRSDRHACEEQQMRIGPKTGHAPNGQWMYATYIHRGRTKAKRDAAGRHLMIMRTSHACLASVGRWGAATDSSRHTHLPFNG